MSACLLIVQTDRQIPLYIDLSVCLSMSVYLSRHLYLSALSANLKCTTEQKGHNRPGVRNQKENFKTSILVNQRVKEDMRICIYPFFQVYLHN